MRNAILLFARSPEREASAKRMRFAAPLFRALVANWLAAAQRYDATPVIACDSVDREALASIAPEIAREWIEQRGSAFGERVARAADEAFARGFDSVLIAAIDAPPHDLGEAFRKLAEGTPVISPSRDGGMNYIGLVRVEREFLLQLRCGRRDAARSAAGTAAFHIVGSTIDLDDERALQLARGDRAWRHYFSDRVTAQPRNRTTRRLDNPATISPRAPPA
ncbi:MAG TPA: DUF2064 domain-containing protein [Thermoanaerobaculia bacterium]|nr:DUF2064 domain-containing protein [Thermoanaerobaculia bacterium]